ncbi:putative ATP-dependent RNA helicase spindle-E, partial [Operophtera brumata]
MVSMSEFWVQYDDESTASDMFKISTALNKEPLIAHTGNVECGDIVAAPLDDAIYRAKVLKLLPRGMLRVLPEGLCEQTPPLAMRCRLAALAPPTLLDPHGQWSAPAKTCFRQLCASGPLLGKILLREGYAISCEESYESKVRTSQLHGCTTLNTANDLNLAQKRAYNKEQTKLAFSQLREIEPPPLESTLHTLMYASREKSVNIDAELRRDTSGTRYVSALCGLGSAEDGSPYFPEHDLLLNIDADMSVDDIGSLRRDTSGTRYVSALCGLGSAEDGSPYFPEHDLLLNIDADMSVDDIGSLRRDTSGTRYVSALCGLGSAEDGSPYFPEHDLLLNIDADMSSVPNAWAWRSVPEDELLEINVPEMVERAVVYPLHSPQELHPVSRDHLMALKRENDNLKLL